MFFHIFWKNKYYQVNLIVLIIPITRFSFLTCNTSITRVTNDSFELVWDTNQNTILGYNLSVDRLVDLNLNNELKTRTKMRSQTLLNASSPIVLDHLVSGLSYNIELNVGYSDGNQTKMTLPVTTRPNPPPHITCLHDKFNVEVRMNKPDNNTVFEAYRVNVHAQNWNGSIELIKKANRHWKSPSILFPNMTKHKSYNVSVETMSKNQFSEPIEVKCQTVSDPPTDIKVVSNTLTSNSFSIEWSPPKDSKSFDGYKVCIRAKVGPNMFQMINVSKGGPLIHHFSDGIKPGHTYEVYVITVSKKFNSYRKPINVTTPPLKVTNLRTIARNVSKISISWNLKYESHQDIFRITYYPVEYNSKKLILETKSNFIELINLINGCNYSIEVIAMAKDMQSPSSLIFELIPPLAPLDLSVESHDHILKVSWKFNKTHSKKDYFKIEWTRYDTNETHSEEVTENLSYEIQDFYAGAKYSVKVCTVSNGMESGVDHMNYSVKPNPPTNLEIENLTNTSANISWRPPMDSLVDYYKIVVTFINKTKFFENKSINKSWVYIKDLKGNQKYIIKIFSISNGKPSDLLTNVQDSTEINNDQGVIKPILPSIQKNEPFIKVGQAQILIIIILLATFISIAVAITIWRVLKKKSLGDNAQELAEIKRPILTDNQDDKDDNSKFENIKIDRNDLTINTRIGEGHFSNVYSGSLKSRDGRIETPVAIKKTKYDRNKSDLDNFVQEAIRMKHFDHAHILTLIGISFDSDGKPLVVLPFMERGDLHSFLINEENCPTVKQLLIFGIQVLKGMEYLSERHIIHRDLATRNCMLDKDLCVKVSDFGLSRNLYSNTYYKTSDQNQALPIKWMAIESIEKGKYDMKSDVWSYGILLWEILTRGIEPYPGLDSDQTVTYLKNGRRLLKPEYCPEMVYLILQMCWKLDPNERPTFKELSNGLDQLLIMLESKNQVSQATYYNYHG